MESRNYAQLIKSARKPKGESSRLIDLIRAGNLTQLRSDFQNKHALINGLYFVSLAAADSRTKNLRPVRILYWAILCSKWEVVEFLLENGANPNDVSFTGSDDKPEYALHLFLDRLNLPLEQPGKYGTRFTEEQLNKILHLFLDKGADFSKKHPDFYIMPALAQSINSIKLSFFLKLIAKMGREAFQASANEIPVKRSTGERWASFLHIACVRHEPAHLELFLRNGADPLLQTPQGNTPLNLCIEALRVINAMSASCISQAEKEKLKKNADNTRMMIDILIRHLGDRVKLPFSNGRTYLHEAAQHGDCESARKLLDLGIDVNTYSGVKAYADAPVTPIYIAAIKGHLDMVRMFAEDPRCDLMLGQETKRETVGAQNVNEIKKTIEAEKKDEIQSRWTFILPEKVVATPLFGAFIARHEAIVRYLLVKATEGVKDHLVRAISALLPQFTDNQRDFLSKFPELQQAASNTVCQISSDIHSISAYLFLGDEELAISQMKILKKEEINFGEVFGTAAANGANKMIKSLFTDYTEEMKKVVRHASYLFFAINYF